MNTLKVVVLWSSDRVGSKALVFKRLVEEGACPEENYHETPGKVSLLFKGVQHLDLMLEDMAEVIRPWLKEALGYIPATLAARPIGDVFVLIFNGDKEQDHA